LIIQIKALEKDGREEKSPSIPSFPRVCHLSLMGQRKLKSNRGIRYIYDFYKALSKKYAA